MKKKLKICIDITSQTVEYATVGLYTKYLSEYLSNIDSENEYLLFGGIFWNNFKDISRNFYCPAKENFKLKVFKYPSRIFPYRGIIPLDVFLGHVDIFHGTNYLLPNIKSKKIATIHDLSFEVNRNWYPENWTSWIEMVRLSVREADHIIAMSNATKSDIIKFYGIKEEKISVIYQAYFDKEKYIPEYAEEIKKKYGLPEKYFLYPGTIEPRKNIKRIISALEKMIKSGIKCSLVIVGRNSYKSEEVISYIENSGIKNNIKIYGFVPRKDIPYFYRFSQALIYPSLCEGFGLPLLEAMANDTLIITSNISSMPEVAGGCALYCDPYDENDIYLKMLKAVEDENCRKGLIEEGKERLKFFSWEKNASETLSLYKSLCQ